MWTTHNNGKGKLDLETKKYKRLGRHLGVKVSIAFVNFVTIWACCSLNSRLSFFGSSGCEEGQHVSPLSGFGFTRKQLLEDVSSFKELKINEADLGTLLVCVPCALFYLMFPRPSYLTPSSVNLNAWKLVWAYEVKWRYYMSYSSQYLRSPLPLLILVWLLPLIYGLSLQYPCCSMTSFQKSR